MSFIDPKAKEINCKVVYYGPPFAGKSTNLHQLLAKTAGSSARNLVTLREGEDHTLFFDFLPLSLGSVKGYKIRLHLYTLPGSPQFESSRKLILKGVDGVVFVADSRLEKLEGNLECWRHLQTSLAENDCDLQTIPLTFQCNKRDLKGVAPVSDVAHLLDGRDAPIIEAVAIKGVGVMETLNSVAKQVLKGLKT